MSITSEKVRLARAADQYMASVYGYAWRSTLPGVQIRETRQAFFSGIHWYNCQSPKLNTITVRAVGEILADNFNSRHPVVTNPASAADHTPPPPAGTIDG